MYTCFAARLPRREHQLLLVSLALRIHFLNRPENEHVATSGGALFILGNVVYRVQTQVVFMKQLFEELFLNYTRSAHVDILKKSISRDRICKSMSVVR